MQEERGEVMAEKGCESCSKWQEHYYREHTDVSWICFYRLMTGDFAHRVSIPEKFAKNFNGEITKGFNLKAFSGETWHVEVEKVADELFLMSGWDNFAKAHELKENDLLFFTCNGKEHGNVKEEMIEEEESDDDYGHVDYYYSRFANYLSSEEREEIFSLASLQPGNPVFVTVLRAGHVHRKNILIIPTGLAANHLDRKSHEILLIRANREEKWYVKYYHANTTRGFSGYRWIKFIRENKLQEGYVCIFELMKGAKRPTMTVHVIGRINNRFVLLG